MLMVGMLWGESFVVILVVVWFGLICVLWLGLGREIDWLVFFLFVLSEFFWLELVDLVLVRLGCVWLLILVCLS